MAGKVETRYEMLRAGYKKLNDGKCKGCGAAIEWWLTTNGKKMPFDPLPESEHALVADHPGTCPKRDTFKSATDRKQDTAAARAKAVAGLLEATGARAVVALYAEGPVLSWTTGLDPEDTRNDGIAAINKLRWQIKLGLEKQA